MKYVTLLILLGITIANRAEIALPKYLIPCEASDEECLKSTLQALEPHLVQGIKEFQLPSIVPLRVPDFNHSFIYSDIDYMIAFTNIEFGQVNNYKVSKISIDLNDLKFLLVLSFPQVTLTVDVKTSLKAYDINWDQTEHINIKNLTINFTLDGTQIFKEGKRYVNWTENKVDVLTDLVNYDVKQFGKKLRTAFAQTINETRESVDQEVRLIVKITLAEYIFKIINIVHDAFPIDVLYAKQ